MLITLYHSWEWDLQIQLKVQNIKTDYEEKQQIHTFKKLRPANIWKSGLDHNSWHLIFIYKQGKKLRNNTK